MNKTPPNTIIFENAEKLRDAFNSIAGSWDRFTWENAIEPRVKKAGALIIQRIDHNRSIKKIRDIKGNPEISLRDLQQSYTDIDCTRYALDTLKMKEEQRSATFILLEQAEKLIEHATRGDRGSFQDSLPKGNRYTAEELNQQISDNTPSNT